MNIDGTMHDDQNPMVLMSQNIDEKIDDDDHNDRFLEEMLAKAARLANEMKEISTKQSMTTSSKSSTGKDGIRRSLPKVIDVQQNDDYTARSECSSLGYSLATATPSVFVVNGATNINGTTPTTMNLLSTTIENCAEGYFLKSHQQSSSTTTNTCSVINEGSVNNEHDDKKSSSDSVSNTKPSYHKDNNAENIRNMSSVDMLIQQQPSLSYLRTPPKVKRTSQRQLDPSGTLPVSSTTNAALQSTILTTKSLSEEINDSDNSLLSPKLVHPPPHVLERPTVLKISQQDDDYVPIADYSIRNTTTKASNTSAVKWEKITTPSIHDDDYVSLKDYSQFPKTRSQSRHKTDKFNASTGLSFAQQRELLIKRRRQRKRLIRRMMIFGTIVASIIMYYCYMNNWFYHDHTHLMTTVANYFLPHQILLNNTIEEFVPHVEAKEEFYATHTMEAIVVTENVQTIEKSSDLIDAIDNETLVQEDEHDDPHDAASEEQFNLDEKTMIPSNTVGPRSSNATAATAIVRTMSETLSIFEPETRQRFVEELIQTMME